MFQIFCNFVALIKLYKKITLQSEIVWEPQGVKKLTTSVNNIEYLDGIACWLKYFYHI